MDASTAQTIIFRETEEMDGFLFRFTVGGHFSSDNWARLQTAIHAYAESLTDDDVYLDRRVAGDLHYLTQVLTLANETLEDSGEMNPPLEAAASALWEYNHKIF